MIKRGAERNGTTADSCDSSQGGLVLLRQKGHRSLHMSFRGARRASPEPIPPGNSVRQAGRGHFAAKYPPVAMDSGLALRAPRNDDG
ncbi:hypothetical protein BRAS3809_530009 [Bradyrhizobium sp. STM 3809]|nr:hypothetical protein BRAS3809_530009 [Bradyrhizobium sp. STM 3809]